MKNKKTSTNEEDKIINEIIEKTRENPANHPNLDIITESLLGVGLKPEQIERELEEYFSCKTNEKEEKWKKQLCSLDVLCKEYENVIRKIYDNTKSLPDFNFTYEYMKKREKSDWGEGPPHGRILFTKRRKKTLLTIFPDEETRFDYSMSLSEAPFKNFVQIKYILNLHEFEGSNFSFKRERRFFDKIKEFLLSDPQRSTISQKYNHQRKAYDEFTMFALPNDNILMKQPGFLSPEELSKKCYDALSERYQ